VESSALVLIDSSVSSWSLSWLVLLLSKIISVSFTSPASLVKLFTIKNFIRYVCDVFIRPLKIKI